MKPVRILVAEDDKHIRDGLADTLESEGYEVVSAADGREAMEAFQAGGCGLLLLDVMMPESSGYDVCREVRKQDPNVPIIMLTAKGEEIDKVVGLELGADDYVTKPFGVHELLARIAAVLRRSRREPADAGEGPAAPDLFKVGEAEIDCKRYECRRGKKTFALTAREIKLLAQFYLHPGEVLSRDRLLNEVWGINYLGTTRTLDQHIAQLRKKVEPKAGAPRYITTVHGVGYRYEG
jgi:DNA-binding response OmpR family regulator